MARKFGYFCLSLVLLAAALVRGPGEAQAGEPSSRDWTVSKVSGEVFVTTDGGAEVPLGTTATLTTGQAVRTGPSARLMLTRGQEVMLVAPGSEVLLKSEGAAEGPKTVIEQRAGVVDFTVDRRSAPHFEVQTPYLAALVKGTVFNVAITPGRSRVEVREGKVQVASNKTGEISLVLPGQAAIVDGTLGALKLVAALGVSNPTIFGIDVGSVQRLLGADEAVASAVIIGALVGAAAALGFAAYRFMFRR